MQYGLVVPTYGDWGDPAAIRDGVRAAEDLGFDTVWFGDHVVVPTYAAHISPPNWFEPLASAFVAAGATKRIRFGVDVLVLPVREPVWLSQLVASADQMCGGRLTLGVGVGYIRGEFAALAPTRYERRGAVADEFLDALHELWETEGPLSFQGEWVQFEDVMAEPKPLQQPFPLWVGGNAPVALRRAALRGTGWHPLFPTPEVYANGRRRILELRHEAGLEAPFTFSYSCPMTRIAMSPEEMTFGIGRAQDLPTPPDYSYSPPAPTSSDGRPMFIGTPEQVADDVKVFEGAGVEHLALRFSAGHHPNDIDDFIDQARRFRDLVVPAS
jgi:probable F420-dependent oxidoreductase